VINPKLSPYVPSVRWERLFEDLEGQLEAEWESERAALDSESERLRLSRVRLRDRLVAFGAPGSPEQLAVATADGSMLHGTIEAVGADFLALRVGGPAAGTALVRIDAVASITAAEAGVLRSARPEAERSRAGLAERMTLGFVLRDLARRRSAVRVHAVRGHVETGTIDRVGADHLDLAVHEPGTPRRAGEVRAHRILPFAGIAWLRLEPGESPTLV
jgi:hypothetical protein